MRRRRLFFLFTIAVVPLLASLGDRPLGSFVAPAAACTGTPRYDASAITILPDEGAVVPRNARVLFLSDLAKVSTFSLRPTEPAEVRARGEALSLRGRSSEELDLPHLEASTSYELWLPDDLAEPWGKPKLARARTFSTSDEDDVTPPRVRRVGSPTFHPAGPTSCGPAPRIELAIEVEDASPSYVEVDAFVDGSTEDRTKKPSRAPIVGGRIVFYDPIFLHVDGPATYATHLVLTPVDIAGNRGAAWTVVLRRLADGGPEPVSAPASAPAASRFGCGKH